MFSEDAFIRRHKIITALVLLVVLIGLWYYSLRRGPHHGYTLDFTLPAGQPSEPAGPIQAGVAKREITIDLEKYDSWVDGNNNTQYDIVPDTLKPWQKALFAVVNKKFKFYDPAKAAQSGDSYVDRNGNGRFDPVWVAGFNSNRPAKGINDPQWVRALALRNNGVTVVIVSIDAIGIYHNEFIDIRKSVNPAAKVDHIIFSSTHSHEVPDTMEIFSGAVPVLNYDTAYIESIKKKAKEAIEEAVAGLRPADMTCATAELLPREAFNHDSRRPVALDDNAYLWRFTVRGTEKTIATLVNWGNHPEALGGDNGFLTSDFCNWLRLGIEEGIPAPRPVEGLGGTCVFVQGPIGGLANPLHAEVPKRDGSGIAEEGTFEKAENLGYNVAEKALEALRGPAAWKNENPFLAVAGKTIKAPMTGMFKWLIMFGFIHEGYYWGGHSKTEVNALRVGDALVATAPGEIYSEIVVGGVEAKPGRDFEVPALEIPSIQSEGLKRARQSLLFGLANDEIGYIIPKSQWDTEKPYVYEKSQYGEQNSGGPDVGPAVHSGMIEMVRRINATYDLVPPTPPAAPEAAPAAEVAPAAAPAASETAPPPAQ